MYPHTDIPRDKSTPGGDTYNTRSERMQYSKYEQEESHLSVPLFSGILIPEKSIKKVFTFIYFYLLLVFTFIFKSIYFILFFFIKVFTFLQLLNAAVNVYNVIVLML